MKENVYEVGALHASASSPGNIGDPGIDFYTGEGFSGEELIESVRNILNLAKTDKLSDTNGNTWYRFPYYGLPQIEKLLSEYEAVLAHNSIMSES